MHAGFVYILHKPRGGLTSLVINLCAPCNRSTLGGGSTEDCRGQYGPIYVPGCAHAPDFLLPNPFCPNNCVAVSQIRGNITQWLDIPATPWDFGGCPQALLSVTSQGVGARPSGFAAAASKTGKQVAQVVGNDPTCANLFEVVLKSTRSIAKAGGFVTVRRKGAVHGCDAYNSPAVAVV